MTPHLTRRSFLKATGTGVAVAGLLAGIHSASGLATQDATTDAFDALRVRWRQMLVGVPSAAAARDVATVPWLIRLDEEARSLWTTMDRSPDRSRLWPDLVSTELSSHITMSYHRLRLLATAYAAEDSPLQHDNNLRTDLIEGLEWISTNRYHTGLEAYDNWWDWEIGTPLRLNDIVVLLYDQLTADQIDRYMTAVDRFSPAILTEDTGANRVNRAAIVGVRGAIVKDGAKLANARDAIISAFEPVIDGDGFYPDGSFLFHDRHPYTGGYGIVMVARAAELLYLLADSPWEVSDPNTGNLYRFFRWVPEALRPLIYNGAMMDMVRGREITRPQTPDHVAGHAATRAIARLSQLVSVDVADQFKRLVKHWILADGHSDFFADIGNYFFDAPLSTIMRAQQIVDDPGVQLVDDLSRHVQFSSMDRIVHLREDYAFGISMSSSRIYNFESINDENLRGWYTGDGMTYLYNNDLNHYSDGYWPTVNPYRLPGTTIDTRLRTEAAAEEEQRYLAPTSWVGGARLGMYGVAGMDLVAFDSPLVAKKSWFMFDEEIVALGAGISSMDGRTIETIVENRRLATGESALTVDGSVKPTALGWFESMDDVGWIHLEGTGGYVFPDRATVVGLRQERTGAWSEINSKFGASDLITRTYLSLWFDHGSNPVNAEYAYILLPNKTALESADHRTNTPVVIVRNTSHVQAVKHTSLGILAANFWSAGALESIEVSGPTSVITQEGDNDFRLAISDPTQMQETIAVTIGWKKKRPLRLIYADSSITLLEIRPSSFSLVVEVRGSLGKSHFVKFV